MTDTNTNNDMDEKKPMKEELNEADVVNAEVDLDDSKVKFLNGGKGNVDEDGQCVLEVASDSADVSFTGLGKEDLLKYADDPFWKRLRIILFVLFWVGWVAMLAAAIVIIVLAPRCPYRPDLKWYHKESAYCVFAKSFKDSNGDGKGDLSGLRSKIPYIQELGAKVISFGSIYKKDSGNGIMDHRDVDPSIGTVADIESMIQELKKSGTKIVLDFIPNHTSRDHTWFQESRKSKDNEYADFYVWADRVNGGEPNNWADENGRAIWQFDSVRNQYYLCQKGEMYPDLNLRSEKVKEKLEAIMAFWLDKGVGGFNVLDLEFLTENANLTDDIIPGDMTKNYPDSLEAVKFFRSVINRYSDKPGRERVLMGVVDATLNQTEAFYGSEGLNVVIDKRMANTMSQACGAACVKNMVDEMLTSNRGTVNKWLGWMVGNEDTSRISQRMGDLRELSALVLQMMLPGTPVMYYGDEIGMKDGTFSVNLYSNSTDQEDMDKLIYRTPMQWNSSTNAGFTSRDVTPWLPINFGFKDNNVASENATFRKESIYKKVVKLLKIRNAEEDAESIQFGNTNTGVFEDLFWFRREAVGFPAYLVAINYGNGPTTHRFSGERSMATVIFHSQQDGDNRKIDLSTAMELQGGESVVIKL